MKQGELFGILRRLPVGFVYVPDYVRRPWKIILPCGSGEAAPNPAASLLLNCLYDSPSTNFSVSPEAQASWSDGRPTIAGHCETLCILYPTADSINPRYFRRPQPFPPH